VSEITVEKTRIRASGPDKIFRTEQRFNEAIEKSVFVNILFAIIIIG